jgi:hypothetical protein
MIRIWLAIAVVCLVAIPAKGIDSDRFVVTVPEGTTDEVVTDSMTGLMWQKNLDKECATCACKKSPCSWKDALKYCEGLEYGTYKNWRLPNVKELTSLVNYGRSSTDPASDFPDMPESSFWSSSTNVIFLSNAWFVFFYYGTVGHYGKTNKTYVRCVRAGT